MHKRQRGITFLGFVIVAAVVGGGIFIAMQLYPMYTEYWSVRAAMKAVTLEPGAATMSPRDIHAALQKRFDIAYVESVKPENIFLITQGGRKLRITYEVRKPLIYNLDVVGKFDHTVDLQRQSAD